MSVCVCACVKERYYYGFVLKNAPQSTAVQKAEAPKPWALLCYPQCSAGRLIYSSLQRWKWEENSWFECSTQRFLFISPLSSNLFCPQRENETEAVLCVHDGKLYCDMLLSWLWKPHGCTSLSLCRKGKLQQEQIHHRVKRKSPRWGLWWEERKSTGEKLREWYNMKYL